MLTKDLLRTRSSGKSIKPLFLDSEDPRLLETVSALLCFYHEGTGKSVELLHTLCDSYIQATSLNLKLARGLLRVIDARAEFSAKSDCDFPALRQTLFQATAALIRAGKLPDDPAQLPESLAQILPESDPARSLIPHIYPDLPENDILISFREIYPKEVLERYNLSLVQGLLVSADWFDAEFPIPENPALLRRLFKYLRFFRLLVSAKCDRNQISLHVDGPASVLENTAKYGMQLASFFPAVCQLPKWKISALVKPAGLEKKLSLDESANLKSHFTNFSAYTPEEIKMFADYFKRESPEWQIDDTPGFLQPETARQEIIFPDFIFTRTSSNTVRPLELFHRWHASQLLKRLELCEKNPGLSLLIGVDRALLKKDSSLQERLDKSAYFQKFGFAFRDFPGMETVLKTLARSVS